MRLGRVAALVGTVVLAAGLLGGCGLLAGGDDPKPTERATDRGTATAPPEGPAPAELSAQVLAAAQEAEQSPVLGSGSGTTEGGAQVTVDVTSVRRTADGTLVTLRLTGSASDLGGPAHFSDERWDAQNFARTLYLDDPTVTGTRYLPLQFDDYRQACTCPYFPLENGPEPQTLTALYPPLPEAVTSVDLSANDFLTVTGLPVDG